MKYQPYFAARIKTRPKCIETHTEIVDGKEVVVRKFVAAGETEGIRKARRQDKKAYSSAAFAEAKAIHDKQQIVSRLKRPLPRSGHN